MAQWYDPSQRNRYEGRRNVTTTFIQVDSILGGVCQNSLLEKSSGRILEVKGRAAQLDTAEMKHITGLGFLDNHQVSETKMDPT